MIVQDADVLLEFCRYPSEYWVHLRTTNPIESTFATVCLRTRVWFARRRTGDGYKLIEAAHRPAGVLSTHRTWSLSYIRRRLSQRQTPRTPIDIIQTETDGSPEAEVD